MIDDVGDAQGNTDYDVTDDDAENKVRLLWENYAWIH